MRIIIISAVMCLGFFMANAQPSASNPLLKESNEPIAWDDFSPAFITAATTTLIAATDADIKSIAAAKPGSPAAANTLEAFDALQYHLTNLSLKLGVIASTYESDPIRLCAQKEQERLSLYFTNLYLNEGLYRALKQYEASAAKLPANHQKFLRETLFAFEKNGMKLDAAARTVLAGLNEKLVSFGLQFDNNIAESKDSIVFKAKDLEGVPDAIKEAWKQPNGSYLVNINGPNYTNILKYAIPAETRHQVFLKDHNRAYPKNMSVLDSLLYYRDVYAHKLGFRSYAEYALKDKMAAIPENAWKFETNLVEKLKPQAAKELAELKALKQKLHPGDGEFTEWDISFYLNQLMDTKYKVNSQEVMQYFEMNNTLRGMFSVYEKLFDIQIKETKNLPVWDSKVLTYDLYKDGKKAGSFYLDLYPRKNKYTHFACYPVTASSTSDGQEILPVSALLCNFPEGNAQEPSLLNHRDVETLFHEFGHLVHTMMARSDIASQSLLGIKQDFIEAPSQFLENWCWEYESLSLFAKNYKTGAVLPKPLFDKMKQTQLVGISIQYMRQLFFGMLDFTFEDRYDLVKTKGLDQVTKDVYAMQQLPYPEGSHTICSFGHLNGYGAQYYGYLWSKVFAQDMFTVFEKNGVMNTSKGILYRKEILEKGASEEEMDMLRHFLGREPNSDAFLRSLGIDRK